MCLRGPKLSYTLCSSLTGIEPVFSQLIHYMNFHPMAAKRGDALQRVGHSVSITVFLTSSVLNLKAVFGKQIPGLIT
jgi:hypothetical protein